MRMLYDDQRDTSEQYDKFILWSICMVVWKDVGWRYMDKENKANISGKSWVL